MSAKQNESTCVLQFKSKKQLNKFIKNFHSGKGTVVNDASCDLLHAGGGFFDFVRKVASSPITKGIVSTIAAPVISAGTKYLGNAIGGLTGNQEIGNAMGNAMGSAATQGINNYTSSGQPSQGSGIRRIGRGLGNITNASAQNYLGATGFDSLTADQTLKKQQMAERMAHIRSKRGAGVCQTNCVKKGAVFNSRFNGF